MIKGSQSQSCGFHLPEMMLHEPREYGDEAFWYNAVVSQFPTPVSCSKIVMVKQKSLLIRCEIKSVLNN